MKTNPAALLRGIYRGVTAARAARMVATTTLAALLLSAFPAGARAGEAQGPWTVTTLASGFNRVADIAIDSTNTLIVTDAFNNRLQKVNPATGVATVFVSGIQNPYGLAIDAVGNIYTSASDGAHIRKITPGGATSVFAGSVGAPGNVDGTGTGAQFSYPAGVAMDAADNLYVIDGNNNNLRKITPAGVVTTLAGSTTGASGNADGTGTAALFNSPIGLGIDAEGNLYVGDRNNHSIRKVTPAGVVTTFAGVSGSAGSADGTGGAARFTGPEGIKVDGYGNLFVADSGNSTIRKITPGGAVTTIAGGVGVYAHVDAVGTAARFGQPRGIALTSTGTIYVGDWNNNRVRQITPAVAGTVPGANEAPTANAQTVTLSEDGSANITLTGSDPDAGTTLTFSTVANPTNGTLTGTGASRTYTPNADFNGTDSFTFKVNDGIEDSAVATVSITVNSVNDAPSFALPGSAPTPAGTTWTQQTGYTPGDTPTIGIAPNGSRLMAGRWNQYSYLSSDGGVTWSVRNDDTTRAYQGGFAFSQDGSRIYAAPRYAPMLTSADGGTTWSALPLTPGNNGFWTGVACSANGQVVIGGNGDFGYLYVSTNYGATWTARITDTTRGWVGVSASSDGSVLVAASAGKNVVGVNTPDGLYISTDSGVTWAQTGPAGRWVGAACSADGNKLVGTMENGQIYTSTNRGSTWTARETVRTWGRVVSSADGNTLLTTASNVMYRSTDSGATWTADNSRAWRAVTMTANGGMFAAVTTAGQVFTSAANYYSITGADESGVQSMNNFATSISPGPANEAVQTVSFNVTNDNNALFSAQPAIGTDGTLTFTMAGNGTATVAVVAQDNGGTANGGVDSSGPQSFTISRTNSAPTDIALSNASIAENNTAGATIGTLTSADPEGGNMHTFALAGGADDGAFTISGTTLSINGSADFETKSSYSIRIRATDGGALAYEENFTVTITNVTLPQTITFAPLGGKTFGDAPFAVSATASSGEAVTFSIISGPATVAGNTVTITGVGNVTVRASQSGSGDYEAAADVDQSFTVSQAAQVITFAPPATALAADTLLLTATGGASGNAVTFSVVSGPGTLAGSALTFSATGTVVVRASQAGDANYAAASDVERTITVGGITASDATRWQGLLRDGDDVITGYVQVSKNALGVYTASVKIGTAGSGKGVFSIPEAATSATVPTALGALTVTPASGLLNVSIAGNTGSLRPGQTTATRTQYNFALASVDTAIPGGGFGRAILKTDGSITVNGKTPDGRGYSAMTRLADNDGFVLYAVIIKAAPRGLLAGEFALADLPTTDVTGELAWSLPPQSTGLHLLGLETVLDATGSLYAAGDAAAMAGADTLSVSGGNLAADSSSAVTVTAGKPTLGPVVPGWTAVNATGMFTVKVKRNPTTTVTGGGIYLPKSQSAWGFFPGTTEGGRVELTIP